MRRKTYKVIPILQIKRLRRSHTHQCGGCCGVLPRIRQALIPQLLAVVASGSQLQPPCFRGLKECSPHSRLCLSYSINDWVESRRYNGQAQLPAFGGSGIVTPAPELPEMG